MATTVALEKDMPMHISVQCGCLNGLASLVPAFEAATFTQRPQHSPRRLDEVEISRVPLRPQWGRDSPTDSLPTVYGGLDSWHGERRVHQGSPLAFVAGTLWAPWCSSWVRLDVPWHLTCSPWWARGPSKVGAYLSPCPTRWPAPSYPEELRPRVLSTISGMWGAAALVGPMVGGVFAELGW